MKNREIKFRGKSLDTNRWVYGYAVFDSTLENATIVNKQGINEMHLWAVEPKSVSQLVGIKNEYGFDIYEGDIIHSDQWNPSTYQVCFDRGAFYIADKNKEEVADIKYAEQFKVIGNIYENPELLNG